MSDLAKREENGEKGESRTQSILIDSFWVLKRSVDIEGADFLVQIPADDLDEIWERKKKIEVFGVIQAKYFEGHNQVKILKKYVESDSNSPRTDFFAFLHSNDEDGEDIHFFFTANDIQTEFYEDKQKEHYCFSLTKNRNYSNFKNKKKSEISHSISDGMLETEQERNKELIKIVYANYKRTFSPSQTTKIIETNNETIRLEQKGSCVEITKTCKSTETVSNVSASLGNIDNMDYDPISGTTMTKS